MDIQKIMNSKYPTDPPPTTPRPSEEELEELLEEASDVCGAVSCQTTDGCIVNGYYGYCKHGYPTWLLYAGYT